MQHRGNGKACLECHVTREEKLPVPLANSDTLNDRIHGNRGISYDTAATSYEHITW